MKVSDVVYSNLRGDVPKKIGITYDDLKHLNPAIVCCSLTGFGMTGPRSKGRATTTSCRPRRMDGPDRRAGRPAHQVGAVDGRLPGGFVAAISLLAGLHAARRDGVGMDCDVSLYDTAIGLLTYPATWHLNAGFEPARTSHSAHPSLVPFQAFEASDGWFIVGCAKEKFWTRLASVVGHPEWAEPESGYGSFADRARNKGTLIPLLEDIFRQRTVDAWLTELYAASIPCGPINNVEQAMREEHTKARGLRVTTEHPRFGTVEQLASPVRVGAEPPEYRRAPFRNEDFDLVIREIAGYDDATVAELRAGERSAARRGAKGG